MGGKLKTGLRELKPDGRDFSLGAIIPVKDFPKPENLPREFVLETKEVKDQLDDFCTGNTVALIIGINEGFPCDENWSFAKSKELSGDVESWGQDLRTAFKVGVKFGALIKLNSPFTSEKGSQFLRDIKNWPEGLDFFASPQKQKTYWKVTGPYDTFDNIKGTIWYLNKLGQKQGVGIGLIWGYPATQYVLSEIKNLGEGHAISVIGWQGDYLVLQNSWGKDVGKEGRHLISREVVNHFAGKFGAFVYMDLDRAKAEHMIEAGVKLNDNWLVDFFKTIWSFIKNIFWFDRTFGASRSSQWATVRKEFLRGNPICAVCGKKGTFLKPNEVHHISTFASDPSQELNPQNLLTTCREDHRIFCHLKNFRSLNKDIREDAAIWLKKIQNRPIWNGDKWTYPEPM